MHHVMVKWKIRPDDLTAFNCGENWESSFRVSNAVGFFGQEIFGLLRVFRGLRGCHAGACWMGSSC